MKKLRVLTDIDEIKAIAHPYRIEILEFFRDNHPATAKQIADSMGEPHAKINYHIKALQKMDILTLVDERAKSGIIEKYYLPSAKAFVVDKHIYTTLGKESMEKFHRFKEVAKDFYGLIECSDSVDEWEPIFQYRVCPLTKEEKVELAQRIEREIDLFIKDKEKNPPENVETYGVMSLILPKSMNRE